MKKPKSKYKVFYVEYGTGIYSECTLRQYIGDTFAVSEKQACNNVRNRLANSGMKHGPYSTGKIEEHFDSGSVFYRFEAEKI